MLRWLTLAVSLVLGVGCAEPELRGEIAPLEEVTSVAPSVVRRLGRREYDNTVRDLLGVTVRPGARFPADDHAHGFDTIAQVMSVSPTQLELYEQAAEQIVAELEAEPALWSRAVPCEVEPADERGCARRSLEALAPRAWRRPLAAGELEGLLALYDAARAEGDPFPVAVGQALRALLLSPHFLFRIERDPPGPGAHPISDHELATRLSYFLWISMPDEPLRAAADARRLQDGDELERQVHRMLEDPRSEALVDDFAGQWLYIRALDDVFRDVTRYPRFDEELREAMKQELRWMFRSFIEEDRDIRELLLSPRTFASYRLARHYGKATAPYEGVRELEVSTVGRAGLLTTPGLLTALSPPFRTSPTQRGRWVLSQMLCEPLPPPPPGVTAAADPEGGQTIRERLEAHRADPACAGCHAAMDPVGLSFEGFDAIGARRTHEHGAPIDTAGQLPGGESFADARELAAIIADDPAFIACTVRQVFTYAMGRPPVAADEPHLEAIVADFEASGYRFGALLVLIARSVPFRHRRPPVEEPEVSP